MTNYSIFKKNSINREEVHWEDELLSLTPIELHSDGGRSMLFKREDYFAPLGYGGINGAKLRQAVYLGSTNLNDRYDYLVGGMSLHSPQHIMQSALAKHYGKRAINVIGATKAETAVKHEMIQGAAWFGAKFDVINIGYNHNLQMRCEEIKKQLGRTYFLEYGITLGLHHSAQEIYDFHKIGAEQVKNIPDEVTDLVIGAGSCNSSTSVLLGLALYPKKDLKRIHLVELGPSKLGYLTSRLEKMNEISDTELRVFNGLSYTPSLFNPMRESNYFYDLCYYSTYKKIWVYDDEVKKGFDDITFHPRYEAKVFTYLEEYLPELIKPSTLFWIIGSEPHIESMKPYYNEPVPEKIELI